MSELNTPQNATVSLLDNGVSLSGNLLFSTVSSILAVGGKMIDSHKSASIVIDMSKVAKIDSAGIALLLDWKRLCDTHNKKYQLKDVSQQSLSLINTNKLKAMLNLAN